MKKYCPECGVKPGEIHKDGCDIETCPLCGYQLITCECKNVSDEDMIKWSGESSNKIACREFDLWAKFVDGKGWIPCDKREPGATEDLNTLVSSPDYEWDKNKKRWIMKNKKEEHLAKRRKSNKQKYDSRSHKEKAEYLAKVRERYNSMSPKKKEEHLAKVRKYNKQRYDSRSSAEKAEYIAKMGKYNKQKYDSMSPKKKEEHLAKVRKYNKQRYDSRSLKEKAEYRAKRSEYDKQKRASMSPKKKDAYRSERRNSYYQKRYGMSESEFKTLHKEKQKKLGDKHEK